jgi:hypothetical protein
LAKRSAKPFSIMPSFSPTYRHRRLLCARCERTRSRAAKQRDEIAPFH